MAKNWQPLRIISLRVCAIGRIRDKSPAKLLADRISTWARHQSGSVVVKQLHSALMAEIARTRQVGFAVVEEAGRMKAGIVRRNVVETHPEKPKAVVRLHFHYLIFSNAPQHSSHACTALKTEAKGSSDFRVCIQNVWSELVHRVSIRNVIVSSSWKKSALTQC